MDPHRGVSAKPAVSVLMPCLDAAPTVESAVESVLAQTFGDFELLLLDDASSDGTVDLVRSIGDPRVRIVTHVSRRGLAALLNEGIDLAQADCIARMDADDICFPDRFALQHRHLAEHSDVDLVGALALAFDDDQHVLGLLPHAPDHATLCRHRWNRIPLPHPTWFGRADWFRRHRYREPGVYRAEDQELLLRASLHSCYASLDTVLLGYRVRPLAAGRTVRTRLSLAMAQARLFVRERRPDLAALACATAAAKALHDLSYVVRGPYDWTRKRVDACNDSARVAWLRAQLAGSPAQR